MKKMIFATLLITALHARSQDVAGYWYGTAHLANGSPDTYLVELILKQNSTAVQGIINYYFRNTFRSLRIRGDYNSSNRQLSLYDIPVTFFGSQENMEVDCPMDLAAIHRVAIAGSNLSGRLLAREQYRHICPDIVFNLTLHSETSNQDSILLALRNFKEIYQVWTPSAYDTLVSATVQQRTIENFVVNRQYRERENVLERIIEVRNDSITVDFYDNGEVDGDSISVFFNDRLLGANLYLSTSAVHMKLVLDSTREFNTLSMFANNLGAIPPNTALMIIQDGRDRYEVRMSSNFERNATIHIRKKLPGKP